MNFNLSTLPDDTDALKRIIVELQDRYDKETDLLLEQIRHLRDKLFGRKSEKVTTGSGVRPLPLFDLPEPEDCELPEAEKKEVPVAAHTRKKCGRKALPENLPRIEVIHDLAKEEKICGCGCELVRIGEEVSEQLDIVPARIQVIRHVRPKYACRQCEGVEDDGPSVKIAPVPAQIIPKSMASPGLLAHVLTGKFVDALPFYRQEKQFVRLGVELSRATMCNWAMKAAEACQPLLNLLQEEVVAGPVINIDETTLQVLQEPGRAATSKSYMWIFRRGSPGKTILIYQYHPIRKWLLDRSSKTPPKGLLGTAVSYALKQWDRLVGYLEDGRLSPDNNAAENSIRPFVVGRKNWLFSGTPEGARASAALYSLIETAKANGLEPYSYLRHIFAQLPSAVTLEDVEALLPWRLNNLC